VQHGVSFFDAQQRVPKRPPAPISLAAGRPQAAPEPPRVRWAILVSGHFDPEHIGTTLGEIDDWVYPQRAAFKVTLNPITLTQFAKRTQDKGNGKFLPVWKTC